MFQLPLCLKEGIKSYKASLEDLLQGRSSSARFTGIRVPWGIYSQRGGKVYMNRLRLPAGRLIPLQLKAIAEAARTFGQGPLHLTTRQDIQLHGVRIEDTIKVLEYLKDHELSSRGGGGNTIRNITACSLAGICAEEIFDVGPYAMALTEYLLTEDSSYNLPRKFKISFSGCAKDCGGCLVNDVGLLAREKEGRRGFRVFVGGGLGAASLLGQLLAEFIPEEELGYSLAALKNVFYKKGDRRNKHHNRLRFLIKDTGLAAFKQWYEEEFKALKESEYIQLRRPESQEAQLELLDGGQIPEIKDKDFEEFLKYNVRPEKNHTLASVELRIPRGDIAADTLAALAGVALEFPGLEFRASFQQNIFICHLKKSDLYNIFLRLKNILADFLYPSTLLDIVCCKGAATCNLGLCNSPGLAEEIERGIKEKYTLSAKYSGRLFRELDIKINGCPNACGQHPLGLIAFYGVARKVSGRSVPFYRLLLGGRKALEFTSLAKDTGLLIPAKNVPLFLQDFLERIDRDLGDKIDIYTYLDERGISLAQETGKRYAYVPSYEENKDFYRDWGKAEDFSLVGLGPGECGAGVLDMMAADLTEAENHLQEAARNNYAIPDIQKALFFSSRALLVVKGADPKEEEMVFRAFVEKFIGDDLADPKFSDVLTIYTGLKTTMTLKERKDKFLYAREFFNHLNELYKKMDPFFNFPKRTEPPLTKEGRKKSATVSLDLKGTPCPLNYVKAKLFLEELKAGDIVSIWLDEGEPMDNVPKSLKNDGHEIITVRKLNGFYEVVVKKRT